MRSGGREPALAKSKGRDTFQGMAVRSWGILIGASAGLVVLACLVGWLALRLIRSNRDQLLASGALVPEQQLTIPAARDVILLLETPRMQTNYSQLAFELVDQATGAGTTMRYDYARAQGAVHGMSTMRIPFGRMTVKEAGTYSVRVSGMEAGTNYAGWRIVLSRPYLGRMVLQIVGIVFCAVGALLCLILAAWQIFPPHAAA
jgi:hypothetical protein